MKRLLTIIGIALALWGLYIISSKQAKHESAPQKATAPQTTENLNFGEAEKPKSVAPREEEAKPLQTPDETTKIDLQKKRELLQKQSVFKEDGK